jgi:hypothetical protein
VRRARWRCRRPVSLRQHPRRRSTGDGYHTDDRHRAGGNGHEARPGARGEEERNKDRDAVAAVGASADQPEPRLREIESLPHLRQEQTVGEARQAIRDRDQRQPRRHKPSYVAPSVHASKRNPRSFRRIPNRRTSEKFVLRLSENSRTHLSKTLRTAEMGHRGPVLAVSRYQHSRSRGH